MITRGKDKKDTWQQPVCSNRPTYLFFLSFLNEGPAYLCLLVKVRVHKQMMHDSPHHSTHGGNQYGSTYLNLILRVKHE